MKWLIHQNNYMKITKSQLKQIIKEEVATLAEIDGSGRSSQLAQDIAAHRASQGKGPRNSPNRDEDLARARGEQHQEVNLDDDLIKAAIWYYKNQGGLSDLGVIAGGRPLPDVVDYDQSEAEKILLIVRALEVANTPK